MSNYPVEKPRFPLSVERHFCFRSRIDETGEILEADSFKALYKFTRQHLRAHVLYRETEYKYADAVIEFGYYTTYEIRKGYAYTEFTCLHDFGCLQISSLSEWFYSTDDECNHLISGKGEE